MDGPLYCYLEEISLDRDVACLASMLLQTMYFHEIYRFVGTKDAGMLVTAEKFDQNR